MEPYVRPDRFCPGFSGPPQWVVLIPLAYFWPFWISGDDGPNLQSRPFVPMLEGTDLIFLAVGAAVEQRY
jgi:hypothetical protein